MKLFRSLYRLQRHRLTASDGSYVIMAGCDVCNSLLMPPTHTRHVFTTHRWRPRLLGVCTPNTSTHVRPASAFVELKTLREGAQLRNCRMA